MSISNGTSSNGKVIIFTKCINQLSLPFYRHLFVKQQAPTYNFNSENYMLSKILTRRLMAHQKIIYFFSKDPFEKFNRKKTTNQAKQDEEHKNRQADKNKNVKNQHYAKMNEEQMKKQFQSKHHQRSDRHQEQNHTGFQKFGQRASKNTKPIDRNHRETQFSKDNDTKRQQSHKNESQEWPEEQHQKRQEQAKSNFKQDEEEGPSTGFQKFKRKRSPPTKQKSKQPQVKKKEAQSNMESPKQQQKLQQGKKYDIPKINLDLNSDNNEEIPILRKPRGQKIKKQKEQNQNHQNEPINNAQPSEPQSNINDHQDQDSQTNKKWEEFQRQKQRIKASQKYKILRYERQNLLKDTDEQLQKKKNRQRQQKPVDFKKNFTKLIIAGVGLILLSNNQYFKWNKGREVDPQYLKQALQQDRVDETWVQNTESDLHNDQNVKGKNFASWIYVRQKNGDTVYCVSNEQFEKVWFSLVDKHNQLVERRTSDVIPISGHSGQMHQTVRKITLRPKQEDKNSSLVADARSVLSMVLLYFFIKSIMEVSKGTKGKTGKGVSGLFQNQKSHRFREVIKVTFQDVVGMQKAKDQIVQFIDFLKFPQKYNKLGARIPKGALLTGPPGTGKTMIAKACAGESKVPFFTISGSEFIEMYVGVGAQRVRNLFKQAKENAPSIIFIDQIDAVGKKRSGMGGGGNDERDTTLNQLLVEMDGFDTGTNVIVFAATNQKEVLDPALTRPGRFDRMIEIDLPDLEGRREIFQVHLKPLVLDSRVDIKDYAKRLATLTPGFSGADIKNVCNQAAIIAARNNKQYVSIIDFELATERIIGGVEKRSQLITPETRKTVAYHECGHGVVSWFIENANPLLKLTIIPRSKGALGFAQYLPKENQMYTKVKLLDEICVILGGRIAEEIFFNKISTGASDDLNKAYQIAKAYVTQFGFGDRLGWIQYGETEYAKEYSKDIENKIDAEILQIMRVCSQRTRTIITEKKELIHKLAEKLLQLETIDQNIITGILGERPFKMSKQHEEYIKQKKRISEEISKGAESSPEGAAQMKRSDFVL